MNYEWDSKKAALTLEDRGISFDSVEGFEWDACIEAEDIRADYGEVRVMAIGYIGKRLHVLTYTMRSKVCRVISLRKASKKEIARYANT